MSGTLRTYDATTLLEGGRLKESGSLVTPIGEVSIDGTYKLSDEITIGAGDSAVIWSYLWNERFALLKTWIIGDGYLYLALGCQKPTDAAAEDYSPSSTDWRWDHLDWTCECGVYTLNTDLKRWHATAASEYADSSGVPGLWTSAGITTGKVYLVHAMNPGTDPVRVGRFVAF